MSSSKEKKEPKIGKPTNLLCEYTTNPIGIDVLHPRFSWELRHSERGRTQSAYQILVSSTRANLLNDVGDMWDSGKVESSKSVNVEYEGKPLESGRIYYWKVRWWDDDGRVSSYSEIATFETGLLAQDDWNASACKWIEGGALLRTRFIINRKVKRARAYVCGLGYCELRINGRKVGDHQLDPGWTDYNKLVLYSTYDVTEFLREGENAIGVMLGNGRYIKQYGYGSPKLILQINLEFSDGSNKMLVSDETWKVSKGPIIENDIYDGETYDARLEKEGWDSPGYDDSGWENAEIAVPPGGRLVSQAAFPPIKAVKTIQPISISNPEPGVYVYDFGQNFSGWVRLTVKGPRGANVKLRYAELLHPDGTVNQLPLGSAKATDTYILKGEGVEVYEPRFTYHGFRYVEVTGFPGTPNLDTLQGVVVHTAVEPVGGFTCSNSLINSIHKNVIWTQLNNLMSVPTDCPQRAERMGWMCDAHVTCEEAIYNFDMAAFYTKWIHDMIEAQKEDGSVPDTVPPYWQTYPADPAWGTACVIVPWYLYMYYGDERILKESYQLMKGWVDFLGTQTRDEIVQYSKYGDWLTPGEVIIDEKLGGYFYRPMSTPGELVSTWFYALGTLLLSKIARLLGKTTEAEEYAKLFERIKEAFNKEFLKKDYYATGSQTSNLLPLYLDMVPEDRKEAVFKRLVENVELIRGCHPSTGIAGTRYLFDTLTKYGRADLAYKMAAQTTYPSWGYMIREGATTIWERWEYVTGSAMNSHDHPALGSIDSWFYKALAGINVDPSTSGFERIIIKPHVVADLKYVSASVNTIRGTVSSNWRKEGNSLILEVTLPVNSKGKVHVPDLGLKNPIVKESNKIVWKDGVYIQGVSGIISGKRENGYIIFEVGSGSYSFWIGECRTSNK